VDSHEIADSTKPVAGAEPLIEDPLFDRSRRTFEILSCATQIDNFSLTSMPPSENPIILIKGAERARTLIDMRIRGRSFEAIGNALRITRARAQQIYQGYLQKLPSGAIEEHRAIERERIADLRARLWAEMNGRPDPNFPDDESEIRKPSPKVMGD
jgi:hypothetical protein